MGKRAKLRHLVRYLHVVSPRTDITPSLATQLTQPSSYSATSLLGIIAIAKALDRTGMSTSPSALWKIGFGTVSGSNLMSDRSSLMGTILLANSPQAVLSYLYLSFNTLYTNMFVGREWASYSLYRKALRVSSPRAQQRSTYFLSVPFRYAILMTVLSGAFHWLASQSLFMVRISVTSVTASTQRAVRNEDTILTTGFSPLAIILTTVVATVIAIGGIVIGRLEYPAGMPVAGSNSAAISAACHPPEEDVDAAMKPVRWGVVPGAFEEREHGGVVGHVSFSSLRVETPVPGRRYA